MSKQIELVESYAKRGHSLSFTAVMMGISYGRLRKIIDKSRLDIHFASHRSAAKLRHLSDLHESLRGRPPHPASLAALEQGRATQHKHRKRYTAFGVTGTLPELKEHFGCPVGMNALRERLRKGMPIEEALTLERQSNRPGIIPPQLEKQVNLIRRRAADRCHDIVLQRITPDMLVYKSHEHDIAVIRREVALITVEIRTKTGILQYRLRFTEEFSDQVLFVYSPVERERIDLIAFNPSSRSVIFNGPVEDSGNDK